MENTLLSPLWSSSPCSRRLSASDIRASARPRRRQKRRAAEIYSGLHRDPGRDKHQHQAEQYQVKHLHKGWSTDSVRPGTGVTKRIKRETMAGPTALRTLLITNSTISFHFKWRLPRLRRNLWPKLMATSAIP